MRWLKFNLVGAAGVVVQLGALAAYSRVLGWPDWLATSLAVETAVLHNFIWHCRYTWAERAPTSRRNGSSIVATFFKFNLMNGAVSLAGNVLLTTLLTSVAGLGLIAANLLSIAACSVVNFLLADHIVFAFERA